MHFVGFPTLSKDFALTLCFPLFLTPFLFQTYSSFCYRLKLRPLVQLLYKVTAHHDHWIFCDEPSTLTPCHLWSDLHHPTHYLLNDIDDFWLPPFLTSTYIFPDALTKARIINSTNFLFNVLFSVVLSLFMHTIPLFFFLLLISPPPFSNTFKPVLPFLWSLLVSLHIRLCLSIWVFFVVCETFRCSIFAECEMPRCTFWIFILRCIFLSYLDG